LNVILLTIKRSQSEIVDRIFEAFGCDPKKAKLVNGHVPKDITQGEDVILAGGKVYLIDGGMSHQYKNKTDIGGYTLISDSFAYYLVSHSRFESADNGQTLKEKIEDLTKLIEAYRHGTLKEASLKEK